MKFYTSKKKSRIKQIKRKVNKYLFNYYKKKGYTVKEVDGVMTVIGKNAKTGQDDPAGRGTTGWAEIIELNDGTFVMLSLSNDERFKNGNAQLEAVASTIVEEEIADELFPGYREGV